MAHEATTGVITALQESAIVRVVANGLAHVEGSIFIAQEDLSELVSIFVVFDAAESCIIGCLDGGLALRLFVSIAGLTRDWLLLV